MSLFSFIAADWKANDKNWKGRLMSVLFRLASAGARHSGFLRLLWLPYIVFYKILTEVVMGYEVHWKATIGPGMKIYHGYGLVLHSATVIGANVTLRHGTTIGECRTGALDVPTIGDDVDIGCNAIIVGSIHIGSRAKIGAGAFVNKDVPEGGLAVGNPARITVP